MAKEQGKHTKVKVSQKVLSIIGLIMCVVFGFLLICNITIIVKGTIKPDRPPSVFGITPMVVLSGSMSGTAKDHIEAGDLIFVGKAKADELKQGDVIAFMEQDSATVVTHRIVEVQQDTNGEPFFITKGDANNTEDELPVNADNLVGLYRFRIAKMGDFALFLQEPLGMVIFIGIPVLAFIIYDIIRRQRAADQESRKTSELEAELERLRALTKEQGIASEAARTDGDEKTE